MATPPPGNGLWYYINQSNANSATGGQLATGAGLENSFTAYNATSGPPNPYLTNTAYTNPGFVFGGWVLNDRSDLSKPIGTVYPEGTPGFNGNVFYYTFYPQWDPAPPVICFREGSTILTHENGADVYKPVETLRPGALVKTLKHGYLPISVIGHSQIYNPANAQRSKNRLYKLAQAKYPELTSDLYVTGCHSILVDTLSATQEDEIREDYNTIFVTDKMYRLPAYLDERAEPFAEEGNFTIWHFALEGEDERKNHGVYANGLLVESSFRKHVESRAGMTLIQ